MEIDNIEYKLIRTIEKNDINEENFRNLKTGIYFLIKKEFSVDYLDCKTLTIYYKPIFRIKKDHSGHIILLKFRKNSYKVPGWSVTFRDSCFEDYKKIEFAGRGVFDVDDEFRDKGLGSYLLDSLLIWSKTQSLTAKVCISRSGVPSEDENYKRKIRHFYDKRNIHADIAVGETISCMEDTKNKVEEIDLDIGLVKLFEVIYEIEVDLKNHKSYLKLLDKLVCRFYKREIFYHILIIILSFIILSFSTFIAVKFKIIISLLIFIGLFSLSDAPYIYLYDSITYWVSKFRR